MTAILIEPVKAQSKGSFDVEITAIDPTVHDCLIGTITTPGKGTRREQWNLGGLMRNGSPTENLDMHSDLLTDVISLAKKLGAPS